MDNAQISAYDQALRETFTVEETGAVLTYEGAVPLVEQTCSLLPHAMGIPPPRPTYEELETMTDGNPCYFISNIRLPPAVGIPTLLFHGTPRTSKSEAKRAVAFEAAKALRKYKLLNEYLLPHREKKGDEAEDGNGRHVGEDLAFEVDVHVRPTWGDIYAKGARLYLHPISVNGNTSVGIVAAREILVNTEIFHLWYGRDQDEHEVPVRTYPGRPIVMPAGYTRARLHDALARYSHNMMTRCIRPNYQMEGRLACLFAPLDPTGCLDVATLEQLADGLTRKVDGPSDSRFLAFDSMGRQIQIEKVRQNLKPSSRPIEVEQPSGEMVCREAGFSSYDDYALKKLTYMTGTSTLLESEDECMLQVVSLRRRRNNLVSQYQAIQADGIHGRTKGHPQGQRFIVPRKLIRVSNIPLETRDAYMVSKPDVICWDGSS
jgi:endoribonuclease Dicer